MGGRLRVLMLGLLVFAAASGAGTARSTPAAWQVVATPNPGPVGAGLSGVSADSPTDAWAAGSDRWPLVLHWNGTHWKTSLRLDAGTHGRLDSIAALSPTDVWAVGTVIEHWNGTAWDASATVGRGDCDRDVAGTLAAGIWVADCHGDVWHQVGSGWQEVFTSRRRAASQVLVLSPTNVWISWLKQRRDGFNVPMALHWDGKRISAYPLPEKPGQNPWPTAIAGHSRSDIWVTGINLAGCCGYENAWAAHWDGTSWTRENPPNHGFGHEPSGIAVSSATDVRVVGLDQISQAVPLEYRWNGSAWSISAGQLPYPAISGSLNGVTAIPGTHQFWAVGGGATGATAGKTNIPIILHCCG